MLEFKILEKERINEIIPLVYKLNQKEIPFDVLEERFSEMVVQNYECAVMIINDLIIGVCGLWYCTRHYSGKSVEPDHVFIEDAFRGKGYGKQFFDWIYAYVSEKGYEAIELNTYVSNHKSHKFYFNEDFKILGYHFLKWL
ncbi:GNAT family N-acetyltransferase [Aestuariivivens sediminicola]|uniref:GNAT family N-acetyltransferase n=1 Tax=Aestuariivivens sediminicola TaxID=2913560 RepID=UPI001F5A1AA8|nr:GNAT family N-acetyltransferase [Aestuariivivens sediminicola]